MPTSFLRSSQERTGDGRVRQPDTAGGAGRVDAVVKTGRTVGAGAQALAWGRVTFTKSTAASTSVSTSPETDPGDSDLFPFFQEEELEVEDDNVEQQHGEHEQVVDSDGSKNKNTRKLDYQNPLFHMPLESDSEREVRQTKATASMFPDEDTPRTTVNGSNPMFSRTSKSSNGTSGGTSTAKSRSKSKSSKSEGANRGSSEGTAGHRKDKKRDKTGKKAVYEHVGRIDVRTSDFASMPRGPGYPEDDRRRPFRVDTFARNEGDNGGVAHFKFVFTLEPANELKAHQVRPVLDAVHERDTGKICVTVNDGRTVSAMRSAIEVVLPDIGAVLFNPRVQAKGHHLYTLSLGSSTLFSVLA